MLHGKGILLRGVIALGFFAGAIACGAPGEEDADGQDGALTALGADDLPWEVRTREGELVLPNVFYAEASETDQLMPTKIHGRHQIDRLVYPTIGNPNLYVRSSPTDAGLAVLRIEEGLLAHLGATWDKPIAGSPLGGLELAKNDERDGLTFFLVSREARGRGEAAGALRPGNGVFEVKPSALVAHRILPEMPEAFKKRRTVRAEFDRAALASVPPGLYDIRFEVRKEGKVQAFEFQYNALRIFENATDEYSVVNVTDTQVTTGTRMEQVTLAKMREFVQRVNVSTDPNVRNAAFVTFNGDLHNGGSPEVLLPNAVANTYQKEAEVILDSLKDLRLPIFLTAGNHDGYVSTGHALPGVEIVAKVTFQDGLKDTIRAARPDLDNAQFDRLWQSFEQYREATDDVPGGRHVDVFTGAHVRQVVSDADRANPAKAFQSWKAVDPKRANMVLYDGFNQWRRTYGPLYTSWDFGKSRYVNMNTYELRQHRRSGWGMYTVNYGGGISRVQAAWVEREVNRAEKENRDIVLIGHHDPRGGHNGVDYPYQFGLIDYRPLVSSYNYVLGEVYNKFACTGALDWVRAGLAKLGLAERQLSCLHDGLQEWMRPDEFDCTESNPRDAQGRCIVNQNAATSGANRLWSSGYSLIHKLATHPNVRTVLLGHTHYNSLEILEEGDEIVPGKIVLDADQKERLEALEFATTLRSSSATGDAQGIVKEGENLVKVLGASGNDFHRHVEGKNRELLILRTTSVSNLTTQKLDDKPMFGFATLKVSAKNDARAYATPQVNEITFFINNGGSFEAVKKLPLDRTKRITSTDKANPVNGFFTGK